MKPRAEDYAETAAPARKWGLPLVRFWGVQRPTCEALLAGRSQAPQVNLTVIHVQAGAVLSVGGVIFGPRTIPAPPHRRDAITAEEGKS